MRFPKLRVGLFMVAASVLGYWLLLAAGDRLGPDPGKVLVDWLGQGALTLLLLTLSMTPLRLLTGWPIWIICRRQLGLWSAFYAFLHLLAFLTFILGWNLERLAKELLERPYIFVGFVALTGLVPLVVTSNRTSMRYLGRRWVRLHRLVYVILVLALLHMLWVVRSDLGRWLIYAVPGVVLLAVRFPVMVRLLSLNARAGKPK